MLKELKMSSFPPLTLHPLHYATVCPHPQQSWVLGLSVCHFVMATPSLNSDCAFSKCAFVAYVSESAPVLTHKSPMTWP